MNRQRPSPSHHALFFETAVAPQLWKKREKEDDGHINERLYWSEHEQWTRQCDLPADELAAGENAECTSIIMNSSVAPLGIAKGRQI